MSFFFPIALWSRKLNVCQGDFSAVSEFPLTQARRSSAVQVARLGHCLLKLIFQEDHAQHILCPTVLPALHSTDKTWSYLPSKASGGIKRVNKGFRRIEVLTF